MLEYLLISREMHIKNYNEYHLSLVQNGYH